MQLRFVDPIDNIWFPTFEEVCGNYFKCRNCAEWFMEIFSVLITKCGESARKKTVVVDNIVRRPEVHLYFVSPTMTGQQRSWESEREEN